MAYGVLAEYDPTMKSVSPSRVVSHLKRNAAEIETV